jgi:hypothetical protein
MQTSWHALPHESRNEYAHGINKEGCIMYIEVVYYRYIHFHVRRIQEQYRGAHKAALFPTLVILQIKQNTKNTSNDQRIYSH